MAITRIKNNQITDSTIVASAKVLDNSVTAGKLETNLVYPSNLTVTGDLTVNGTTTTINTTNTTVEDPILVLGSQQTGTPAVDFGFIGERGTDTNVAFIWDEETDEWILGFTSAAESSSSITVTGYADMHVNGLTAEGAVTMNGDLTVPNLDVTNDLDVDGIANLDNTDIDGTLDVAGATTTAGITNTGNIGTTTLSTSGAATLDSASITNNATVGGTLGVTGTSTLGVTNAGATTVTTLGATGAVDFDDTLNVDGAATFQNDILLEGGAGETLTITDGAATTFNVDSATGNTTISGTLGVTGDTSLSTVSTSGLATLDSASITNNATIGGTLGVTGASTLGAVDAGATVMDSAKVENLTQYQIVVPTAVDGTLGGYAALTYNGTELAVGVTNFTVQSTTGNTAIAGTLDVDGQGTVASLNVEDLTDNRIVFAGTSGELEDSADLTFDGATLALGVDQTIAGDLTTEANVTINGGAGENFTITDGTSTTMSVETSTGNTTIAGTLGVTGNTTLGAVTASGAADFNGATTMGDLTIDATSTLDAGGNKWTNLADGTNAQDAVTVAQLTAVTSAGWTISDGTTSQVIAGGETLNIEGTTNEVEVAVVATDIMRIGLPDDVTLTGNLTAVNGSFSGTMGVTGATTLSTLGTSGLATLDSASVTNNATVGGTLGVTGAASLNGGTTTTTITASGLADLNGNLDVAGSTNLQGTLDVDGTITGTDNLDISGGVDFGSTLDVTGVSTLGVTNTGVLTAASGSVTANWTVNGALDVDGATTLDAVTIDETLDVNGATTMSDLTIDATSTIDMGANTVGNVADAVANTDAVTLQQMNAAITAGGATLTVTADTGTPDGVLIGTDTLDFEGTTNEIETAVTDNKITIGLPNDVTIGNNLTVTTGLTTGTLTASGLADLNGNLDVQGTSNFTGAMTTTNITTTGTLDVTGQINIDDLTINGTDISATAGTQITIDPFPAGGDAGGDVIIYGNLQVTGTQTTVNSTVVQIDDPMMSLGTDTHTNAALDSGLKIQYTDGADKDAFIGYDISAGEFVWIEDATDTAGVMTGSLGSAAFGSMRVTDLTEDRIVIVGANGELEDDAGFTFDGTTLTAPNISTTGLSLTNLTVTGTSDLQGAVTAGAGLDVTGATTLDAVTASGAAALNGGTTTTTLTASGAAALNGGTNTTTLSTTGLATLDSASITNNATVGGTLGITGTTTAAAINATDIDSSTLDTTGNVTVGGTLDVTGATTLNNNVTIEGGTGEIFKVTDGASNDLFIVDANNGNVTVDDGAFVANSTTDLNGDVTFGTAITIDAGTNKIINVVDPTADQDAATKKYVDDQITAGGSTLDIAADSGVDDGVVLGTDTLTVSGTANEIETSVSGDTITVGLVDNVQIAGTLSTGGAATLDSLGVTNGATVTGTLDVDGTTELDGLNVDGATTMDALTADGAVSFTSTLGVTGVTTLTGQLNANGGINADGGAFTVADTTGNVATTGTMTVGGTLDVDGNTTLDDAVVDGTFNATGAADLDSTLNVDGAATFQTDVTIEGGVGDTFKITDGAATTLFEVNAETGAVDANGALTVAGVSDFNDAVTMGDLTIDGSSTVSMGSNVVNNVADGVVATDAVNKGQLDAIVSGGWILTDGSTNQTVELGQTVTIAGTANEVNVAVSAPDTMTIGLPDDVTITNNLTVTADVDAATGTIGTFDATTVTVSGASALNGGITVDGTAFVVADTTGNTSIAGTLGVTGASTFTALTTHNGGISATTAAVTDLTSGRVVLAGTGGELEDSAALTWTALDGLGVDNKISVQDDASFYGDTVLVDNDLDVNGTSNFDGLMTLEQGFVLNGGLNQDFSINDGAASDVFVVDSDTGATTITGSLTTDNVVIDGSDITSTGTELTINSAGADVDFIVAGDTDANLLTVDAGTDTVNIATGTPVTDVTFQVGSTDSAILVKGTTAQRPAVGVAGMLRYNTDNDEYEFFDGGTSQWTNFGTEFTVIASETFNGDDSTVAFTLSSSQTTSSCIVSINGVVQLPTTAYGVSGTTLTFTEAPATGDVIEVRQLTTTTSITGLSDGVNTIEIQAGSFEITGDLIPSADDTYKLGSATKQWSELHVAGSTIYLGGFQIKNDGGTIKFLESDGLTSAPLEFALDPDVTVDGGTF